MRVTIWSNAVLACCMAIPVLGWAADTPPPLTGTDLLMTIARNCQPVTLATWRHPTRRVLDRPGVTLVKLDLCNDGHFPIFYVNLKYDPMGRTDSFFLPLYAELAGANGNWPFALVSLRDGEIVEVTPRKGSNEVSIAYETFSP